MKKLIIAVLMLTLNLHAVKLDKELVQTARCSGVMMGNSYIDYASDNISRKEFEKVIIVANSLYLKQIVEKQPSKDEVLRYDSIVASAMDQLVLAADNESFDSKEYEEVIGCYQKHSIQLLSDVEWDTKLKLLIEKASKDALHNIDAILGK